MMGKKLRNNITKNTIVFSTNFVSFYARGVQSKTTKFFTLQLVVSESKSHESYGIAYNTYKQLSYGKDFPNYPDNDCLAAIINIFFPEQNFPKLIAASHTAHWKTYGKAVALFFF